MGFRDELEAARARIESLEREAATLRAAKRADPPFAVLSAALVVALALALAALGVTWSRATSAEAMDARHRHDAERNEESLRQALHDANARYETVTSSTTPAGGLVYTREELDRIDAWIHDGAVVEEWSGEVTEHMGDAPAAMGTACAVRIERVAPSRRAAPVLCRLSVRCGERELGTADGEPRVVECRFDGHLHVGDPTRPDDWRVRGGYESLALDDGPVGTWSMGIAPLPR